MTKIKYVQTLVFFTGAFLLTYFFNRYLPEYKISAIDIKSIITGFGPLLSGLICFQFFRTPNTYKISFNGVKPFVTYSILGLAFILPLLFITKIPKGTIISSITTQFIYSLGEEFGWRHYLLNITAEMNKWLKPFFTGVIWFFWHYSLSNNPLKLITGQDIPVVIGIPAMILFLSLLSFLWADLTVKTKSIFIPTIAHAISKFGDKFSMGIVVTILLLLQVFWNKLKLGKQAAE